MSRRFEFDFDPRYRSAARAFGITPARTGVEISEDRLDARYGRWRVGTSLDNIASVEITGPYAFVKTAGPARLGITDLGLTFASNGRRGVLITFARPVTGIEPFGIVRHPELTVTVADPEGLADVLRNASG